MDKKYEYCPHCKSVIGFITASDGTQSCSQCACIIFYCSISSNTICRNLRKDGSNICLKLDTCKHQTRIRGQLPVFDGYTVDSRLREFRKANYPKELEFISFDSEEGEVLLNKFLEEVNL